METKNMPPATPDDYISAFPEEIRLILGKIRQVIRENAPQAQERMGYGMPGYYLNGGLVWFGAFKRHIGFFPGGGEIEESQEEVAKYRTSKGTLQFPLDQPIPYDLIARVVRYRVAQNLAKKKKK